MEFYRYYNVIDWLKRELYENIELIICNKSRSGYLITKKIFTII